MKFLPCRLSLVRSGRYLAGIRQPALCSMLPCMTFCSSNGSTHNVHGWTRSLSAPLFSRGCLMPRVGLLGTNPSGCVRIFDFPLTNLSTDHVPSHSPPPITLTNASYTPTDRNQAPKLANASPASASLSGRDKKHYRNEMSTLSVQEIQGACTMGSGADAGAIQCLAVVYPLGGAFTRSALKVCKRSSVGHHGYQEFSGLVDGRWYCRLCKRIGGCTWMNEKDILDHVWNTHCDPPPWR